MKYRTLSLYLIVSFFLSACDKPDVETATKTEPQEASSIKKHQPTQKVEYKEIEWEDLVPEGYRPDDVLEEYQTKYNLDELEDSDPLVIEVQAKLKELMASAPVDESFEGKSVKLPGYLLPLDTDGQTTSEFLLVPYFGACIHVPPPPANQTIYVKSTKPVKTEGLYDPIWVSGTINVEHKVSEYADAGYSMTAHIVEEYEVPEEELQANEAYSQ